MTLHKIYEFLYAANFALLFTHEIDSVYWKEWDLFGLPGGIQLFLLINLGLFVVAIVGYSQLLRLKRSGYWFSLLLAVAGIFAFSVHTFFILSGHPEFTLLGSELLLGVIFLVSLVQAILTVRILKNNNSSAA
jgi:hypothetical protein